MPDSTRTKQVVFTLTTPAHHPSIFQDQELPVHNNSGKGRYEGIVLLSPGTMMISL